MGITEYKKCKGFANERTAACSEEKLKKDASNRAMSSTRK